jgi:hypothetical protein
VLESLADSAAVIAFTGVVLNAIAVGIDVSVKVPVALIFIMPVEVAANPVVP